MITEGKNDLLSYGALSTADPKRTMKETGGQNAKGAQDSSVCQCS
jgi:hypothetical protein